MCKKFISIALAVTMIAAIFCVGVVSADAAEKVAVGDQVKYIFSVAPINSLGGLTVYSNYDASKLKYISSEYVYAEGMGVVNDLNEGIVNWNDTFAYGLDTNHTDLFAITFDVIADADVEQLGLTSNCLELFDVNAKDFAGDFNTIVTARVEVTHNSTDTDTETETDTQSDTETETDTEIDDISDTDSGTDTDTESDTDTSTDMTTDTSSDTDSDTSDLASSDNTSKKESDTDSSKKPTPDNASSRSTSSSSNNTATSVKTASPIAIVSLVLILMAASAVVFFVKRKSTE